MPVLRNTCTVAAILGFGVFAGAMLAETSVMNLSFPRPSLKLRTAGLGGGVNGYMLPTDSRGQSRRTVSSPHSVSAHHGS